MQSPKSGSTSWIRCLPIWTPGTGPKTDGGLAFNVQGRLRNEPRPVRCDFQNLCSLRLAQKTRGSRMRAAQSSSKAGGESPSTPTAQRLAVKHCRCRRAHENTLHRRIPLLLCFLESRCSSSPRFTSPARRLRPSPTNCPSPRRFCSSAAAARRTARSASPTTASNASPTRPLRLHCCYCSAAF